MIVPMWHFMKTRQAFLNVNTTTLRKSRLPIARNWQNFLGSLCLPNIFFMFFLLLLFFFVLFFGTKEMAWLTRKMILGAHFTDSIVFLLF